MKYYLDTEFIEYPNTIELISIGIKCEDGRAFYAESTCFDERKASQWVKDNVISKLRWYGNENSGKGFCNAYISSEGNVEVFGTIDLIKDCIIRFVIGDYFHIDNKPEFWGYYADYDWVVFCWIFGTMMDLPKYFPMHCNDLKQLADMTDKKEFYKDTELEHNALVDAIWNEEFHKYLMEK